MKTLPLLATKLHIPTPRPGLVPRPRLLDKLSKDLQDQNGKFLRKLTLVSAPTGFGKTTLLSEWIAIQDLQVAWVSLDEKDNDPVRFWSYVIAALRRLRDDIGSTAIVALKSAESLQLELLLTGLLNEFNRMDETGLLPSPILVLDDFQTISNKEVHDSLTVLLDNLPTDMHLVISTRADPPWQLARQRARRELVELRASDLRFTPAEVVSFLSDVMNLALSPEDVATLETRTEGWAAGLQLAALAIRGSVTTPGVGVETRIGSSDVSDYIQAFGGSNRFILDYLMEEVLAQQPLHIQEFLLKSSVLDRLTAPLCDAVVGGDDGHAILTQLDRANLFLVRLDDQRIWYRYHHLFGDLLRRQLQASAASLVPDLHRRASDWYEAQGLIAEAAFHALDANDISRVSRLAEENVLGMMERGELGALTSWLRALPDDIIETRPWLCLACCWASVYAGQYGADFSCLDRLEGTAQEGLEEAEMRRIWGHVSTIRLYIAVLTYTSLERSIAYAYNLADRALALLPAEEIRTRSLAFVLKGIVQRFNHDYAPAKESLASAYETSKEAGAEYAAVDLLCQLARVEDQQGGLRQAAAICRQAIAQVSSHHSEQPEAHQALPVIGYAHATLGAIFLEWNRLDEALHEVNRAASLAQQWGQFNSWIQSQVLLAYIYEAMGQSPQALDTLHEANRSYRYSRDYTGRHEASLRLAAGDVAFASDWSREQALSFSEGLDQDHLAQNLFLTRLKLAQYQHGLTTSLEDAIDWLEGSLERLAAREATRSCISVLILQAISMQLLNREDNALMAIERALTLAQPEGYVRTFIREGKPMRRLLQTAARQGICPTYVGELLASFDRETTDAQPEPIDGLVEPLSERELQVLRLLVTPLTSTEIANELVIAPSTVRSHVKNIYSKLGVHRRAECVQRAQELGLI
jgi:LuxR family maltose regulon positive regulatory protein